MSGQIANPPAVRSTARTDVQSNLLADRLERLIIQSKPYIPWVIGLIVASILIAILIATIAGQAAKREASGWTEIYFSQMQADQLELVATDFEGTTAALWAIQQSADSKLDRGLSQIYLDRSVAIQMLTEARELYGKVLSDARDPMLVARATLGVAKTHDAQAETAEAINEYKKLLTMPGSHAQLRESVSERLKFLQSDEGAKFYAWFVANAPSNPRPVDAAKDLKSLPDQPDLQFTTPAKDVEMAPATTDSATASKPPDSVNASEAIKLPGVSMPAPSNAPPANDLILVPPADNEPAAAPVELQPSPIQVPSAAE